VHAVAINLAGADPADPAVKDLVGVFRQFDPLQLGLAALVEQADLHLGGVGGEQGEIDALAIPAGAARVG